METLFLIILLKMMMIKPCLRRSPSESPIGRPKKLRVKPYMIKLWIKMRDHKGGAETWDEKLLKIWK